MKEDLTFFKDEKNKNGSKVKNPKRVFAGKMAHKKHGLSYKQADRASMVAEKLKNYLDEAELEQNNPVNLYSLITCNNTTGGFQVQFNPEKLNQVDITMVAQDVTGVGAYQTELDNMDKSEVSAVFQSLVNDLKTLADSIDRDFEAILKKNGIVRRVQ
jgi:uncharacterized protein YneR